MRFTFTLYIHIAGHLLFVWNDIYNIIVYYKQPLGLVKVLYLNVWNVWDALALSLLIAYQLYRATYNYPLIMIQWSLWLTGSWFLNQSTRGISLVKRQGTPRSSQTWKMSISDNQWHPLCRPLLDWHDTCIIFISFIQQDTMINLSKLTISLHYPLFMRLKDAAAAFWHLLLFRSIYQ